MTCVSERSFLRIGIAYVTVAFKTQPMQKVTALLFVCLPLVIAAPTLEYIINSYLEASEPFYPKPSTPSSKEIKSLPKRSFITFLKAST